MIKTFFFNFQGGDAMAESKEKTSIDNVVENGMYPDPLNTLIQNATLEDATDVHLHVVDDGLLILFRVDGIVHEKRRLTREDGRKLLNQLKAVAELSVLKSFSPQEGQIRWSDGEGLDRDIRVTIVPMCGEECAHLRLLTVNQKNLDIARLGFSNEDRDSIFEALDTLSGLVLVTGVTGSGKTTTMYSMTASRDLKSLISYSIEDPVEFKLPNGQQLEVDEHHGFTMYEGLRTIVRMDPDLMMVGDIRDRDSAIVTARAALSGRLVLATIHGQDAAGAIDSLHYLGVPYYIISSSLRLIVAQKLIRRLCSECARPRAPYPEEREVFERAGLSIPIEVFDPVGCDNCSGYGFKGRIGMFETAVVTPDIAHLIASGTHNEQLRQHFRENGATPLSTDGLKKVAQGITSTQELFEKCNFPGLLSERMSGISEGAII